MRDIGQFLFLLKHVKNEGANHWMADCPASGHSTPGKHLSVTLKDQNILLKCFGQHSADDIVRALGLELADLYLNQEDIVPTKVTPKIVATYDYTDEQGNVLYQKVRFDPKDFKQRHKNGGGEYVWNLNGVRRVLYNLPNVLKAEKTYLVEGEKDAHNLIDKAGVVATTAGGANDWRTDMASCLSGKHVVIIPDMDGPGLALARIEAHDLADKSSLTCILLPDGYKDISDWILLGHTLEELHEEDVKALKENRVKLEIKNGKYVFRWEGFTAELTKVKMSRDTTICQLVIYPPGGVSFRTRLNLESSVTRSKLAKELAGRFKGQEWADILEDITNRTLEEFEKGEPVVEIHSTDEVPDLEYLVAPIIPLGKPSVFFGDPGAGKSQMAAIINLLTYFHDWYDNPLRLVPPKRAMRGLVLDWEADEDDWRRQIKWFTDAFGLGYAEMFYRRCSLPLAQDLEAIKSHIDTVHANYIILDSVSLAAGGDLNHMDVATNYFRALRQINLTSVSLAHTSKDRESTSKTILGSVLFEAGARNVWEVRGQENGDCLDVCMFHRKSNLSKKHTPLGYRITYKMVNDIKSYPESMEWLDPKSVPEFLERMDANSRILQLLRTARVTGEKVTSEALVTSLNIKRGAIDTAISRLRKANIITGNSKDWQLV